MHSSPQPVFILFQCIYMCMVCFVAHYVARTLTWTGLNGYFLCECLCVFIILLFTENLFMLEDLRKATERKETTPPLRSADQSLINNIIAENTRLKENNQQLTRDKAEADTLRRFISHPVGTVCEHCTSVIQQSVAEDNLKRFCKSRALRKWKSDHSLHVPPLRDDPS